MKRTLSQALSLLLVIGAVSFSNAAAGWRIASEPELRKIIPARAPVIKENIETEFRTASGVTDGQGKFNRLMNPRLIKKISLMTPDLPARSSFADENLNIRLTKF